MRAHTWIVLPTYDERQNLEPMVARLRAIVPDARILIVDDASPDGTGEIADALATFDPHVRVLHRRGKEGLGAAYRAAFSELLAGPCDAVVQMDCDFSHDPADVARLLAQLDAGSDLALGSRYVPGGDTPGWSMTRRMISRGGSTFARIVLGLPLRDLTGGFKAWRADLLRAIDLDAVETRGYGFQIEMTWRAHAMGAKIQELPIVFSERRAGQSKMSRRIVLEALLMVVRLRVSSRSSRPSPRLLVRQPLRSRLVGGARGEPVDHLSAPAFVGVERPSGGGLATREAGKPEHRV